MDDLVRGDPSAAMRAEIARLRSALEHIAAFPKMRQATRIRSIMQYARDTLDGVPPPSASAEQK
jgi:hypothetical protein